MEDAKQIKQAIQQICEEKNIPYDSVIETIEAALAAAYRKDFGEKNQNVKSEFNPETAEVKVFDVKTVVDNMDLEELEAVLEAVRERREAGEEVDEEAEGIIRFNPKTEIMVKDAKEIKKTVKIGDELIQELTIPDEFGRMAAQTAKQVIIQRLREVERDTIYNSFKDKEGALVVGTVQRREGRIVMIDIDNAMGILPPEEQISSENYQSGQRIKVLIMSVEMSGRGPQIILSRSHPDFLKELFIMEVPEISAGTVEIKAIAREAGQRSKVAVWTEEENIDPVGSCVGQRGARVQTIIAELGGEKIDIIEWDENVEAFISNALSPAKVKKIELNEEEKVAKVEVKEDQLSLAIGKAGQNVRLAAKLTDWKIDIAGTDGPEEGEEDSEDEGKDNKEEKKEKKAKKKEDKEEITEEKDDESKAEEVAENTEEEK
ncbi:transcription termination/antitermination protein NusA [Patescibacteria group bacterium]|nr:transcription termination/antitermination protein NusA [Patescibacteria group bacterium]